MHITHAFTLTFTRSEVGIHELQIEHLSPKILREEDTAREVWGKSNLHMSCAYTHTHIYVCLIFHTCFHKLPKFNKLNIEQFLPIFLTT